MRGCKPATIQQDRTPVEKVPRAPSWLNKHAMTEWRRIMPLLIERKILTDADMGQVENYVIAVGQVREMQETISKEGSIVQTARGPRAHPAVKIQADAMTRARLLAAELGLTPVSRSRAAIRDDKPDDDFGDI